MKAFGMFFPYCVHVITDLGNRHTENGNIRRYFHFRLTAELKAIDQPSEGIDETSSSINQSINQLTSSYFVHQMTSFPIQNSPPLHSFPLKMSQPRRFLLQRKSQSAFLFSFERSPCLIFFSEKVPDQCLFMKPSSPHHISKKLYSY